MAGTLDAGGVTDGGVGSTGGATGAGATGVTLTDVCTVSTVCTDSLGAVVLSTGLGLGWTTGLG